VVKSLLSSGLSGLDTILMQKDVPLYLKNIEKGKGVIIPYYYKKKRRKPKRFTKKNIKLYLGLTLLCFLIAAALSFITGQVPTLVREKIDGALIAEAERTLGRKLKHSDLDLIEKTLGIKIDASSLDGRRGRSHGGTYDKGKIDSSFVDRIKEVYKGKIDPADIERARQAYDRGKVDPADIDRIRQAYKGGEISRSDIERGKKALNER